jgi:hypothetical protein
MWNPNKVALQDHVQISLQVHINLIVQITYQVPKLTLICRDQSIARSKAQTIAWEDDKIPKYVNLFS